MDENYVAVLFGNEDTGRDAMTIFEYSYHFYLRKTGNISLTNFNAYDDHFIEDFLKFNKCRWHRLARQMI